MNATLTPHFDAAATTTCFDLKAALDRCCGDDDFLAEMIDLMQSSVVMQLAAMDAAIATGSASDLSEAAHAMKGVVSSMSTSRPYELAFDIELLSKSGHCDQAIAMLIPLRESLEQLVAETRHWQAQRQRLSTTIR